MQDSCDSLTHLRTFADRKFSLFVSFPFSCGALAYEAMGYCSGMAFRKAGRVFGALIGVGFMGLQTAKSMGYIDIHWDKIKDDAIKPLDAVSFTKEHLVWIAHY